MIHSVIVAASVAVACAQDKGNRLLEFLDVGKPVDAQFIQVQPDESIEKYAKLIAEAKKKDPEWFAEHELKGKPGTPLKFDEKLMTKEQYDGYLAAWDKRKIVGVPGPSGDPVRLKVELIKEGDKYLISVVGARQPIPIGTLDYDPKKDIYTSMNGDLKFLEEIKAPKESSLRGWTGYEWKSEQKMGKITTKQNIAIGRSEDKKFGYLIYRFQQTYEERLMNSKSYYIRFTPVKKEKK